MPHQLPQLDSTTASHQAKTNRVFMFVNTRDKDLDLLYTIIEHDADDVNPAHVHDELTGISRIQKRQRRHQNLGHAFQIKTLPRLHSMIMP